jgi:hypothetical protein
MYSTGIQLLIPTQCSMSLTSKLTCSLSLEVDVRLMVSAWLRQGPLPAVVDIPHEPVPVGPLVVRLG